MNTRIRPTPRHGIGLLLAVLFMLSGCVSLDQYGRYRLDTQVKADFEAHRVLPQYTYFYSGSDNFPRAIIGIHKDFELVSRLWKTVDLTEEQLAKWINALTHVGVRSHHYDGYTMVSPQGDLVGIWYSDREFTNLYMVGERRVTVTPPPDNNRKSGFGISSGNLDAN